VHVCERNKPFYANVKLQNPVNATISVTSWFPVFHLIRHTLVASTGILKFNSDVEGNVSLLKACQHLLTFVEMPVTCVIFDTSSRLAFFFCG
jgi:hypothetical protein